MPTLPYQVVKVTRAEYEANFGLRPPLGATCIRFYTSDGQHILMEYEFYDEGEETDILENLYDN